MTEPLWQLRSVTLTAGPTARLRDVTLNIRPGVTAVIGCSGAGKTSLLNLLVGFEKPTGGRIMPDLPMPDGRTALFWVPPHEGLWPHVTVAGHLEAVMARQPDRDGRVRHLLAAFDLTNRVQSLPAVLSSGERARLAVARALGARPSVLVMDEPLVHVDRPGSRRYWQVIREHLAATGSSLVFSTHSPEDVLREATRVVCLMEGRTLYDGQVQDLYWRPPTEELAVVLGDVNWLSPDDARLWIGPAALQTVVNERDRSSESAPPGDQPSSVRSPILLRPEQVELAIDPTSPIRMSESRSAGPVMESELVHELSGIKKSFFHKPLMHGPRVGQRVSMKISTTFDL